MAKKKPKVDSPKGDDAGSYIPGMPSLSASTAQVPKSKPPRPQPSPSALIICRNKQLRYISSFNGIWHRLSLENLEILANNNYNSPRPRPIDPAVYFDLLKIRKLVDDATILAVEAASGVSSSSVNSSNAGNELNGVFGIGGGSGHMRLSRERKHRMREQATQKLSKAYHLDDVACSVATMQSASTLEDVAKLVLQRNPNDLDAKYVHFFHEKIPSRELVEYTTLESLDEVIADRPSEGGVLRTRACIKVSKGDFAGVAQDLTEALAVTRYHQNQHRQKSALASPVNTDSQRNTCWKQGVKLDEGDHPSSLETQLLFHRAGVYLKLACQHVSAALQPNIPGTQENGTKPEDTASSGAREQAEVTTAEKEERRQHARKTVKAMAKRALRDYVAFLSYFDYTSGFLAEITGELERKANHVKNDFKISRDQQDIRVDLESNSSLSNGQLSDSLATHDNVSSHQSPSIDENRRSELQILPPLVVYQVSALFSAIPPADLSPYPVTSTPLATNHQANAAIHNDAAEGMFTPASSHEALTYHPFLADALHSLLLCHCLMQTSARELQRHAHMVARLSRLCSGFPTFQMAHSLSRTDWVEVLRQADNWIGLEQSWEDLWAIAPNQPHKQKETQEQKKVRMRQRDIPEAKQSQEQKQTQEQKTESLRQQAIDEAIEDDRMCDEETFQKSFSARQKRNQEKAYQNGDLAKGVAEKEIPPRLPQENWKEYPISTGRARDIIRWIIEAPVGVEDNGKKRKKKKSTKPVAHANSVETNGSMDNLKIIDRGGDLESQMKGNVP